MAYREFGPSRRLADFVTCTWEREIAPAPSPGAARVLPDGCVDLVWRGGDLFVAGPDSRAFVSPVDPGETIVGLRFRTGTAGQVLGLPASELRDARVPVSEIWGAELAERLGEAPSARRSRRALLEAGRRAAHRRARPAGARCRQPAWAVRARGSAS